MSEKIEIKEEILKELLEIDAIQKRFQTRQLNRSIDNASVSYIVETDNDVLVDRIRELINFHNEFKSIIDTESLLNLLSTDVHFLTDIFDLALQQIQYQLSFITTTTVDVETRSKSSDLIDSLKLDGKFLLVNSSRNIRKNEGIAK